jgi:hypothetical protein
MLQNGPQVWLVSGLLSVKSESLHWNPQANDEAVPVLEEALVLRLKRERALGEVAPGAAHGLLQVPLLVESV